MAKYESEIKRLVKNYNQRLRDNNQLYEEGRTPLKASEFNLNNKKSVQQIEKMLRDTSRRGKNLKYDAQITKAVNKANRKISKELKKLSDIDVVVVPRFSKSDYVTATLKDVQKLENEVKRLFNDKNYFKPVEFEKIKTTAGVVKQLNNRVRIVNIKKTYYDKELQKIPKESRVSRTSKKDIGGNKMGGVVEGKRVLNLKNYTASYLKSTATQLNKQVQQSYYKNRDNDYLQGFIQGINSQLGGTGMAAELTEKLRKIGASRLAKLYYESTYIDLSFVYSKEDADAKAEELNNSLNNILGIV